ncbi:DUF6263 family protein [Paludisphaera borealis]|uniref:Uncharacterized protein n=1 Tax=Paludisphaera borealis TaxID=1387353 RepID=A0A1U7CQN4_9BACT|nr:DUF6263 family protein [Paludisphaera borealis]APW61242.1 hypothetical protein BSF38_02754 [Paludisphaera borealis]
MKLTTTGIAASPPRRSSSFRLLAAGCLLALAWTAVGGATARAATTLRWKLKPGEVLHYTMTQNTTNAYKPKNGQEASTAMSQVLNLHWTVKSVSADGVAEVAQAVDRVQIRIEGAAQPSAFQFDSDAKLPPPEGPIAAQLVPLLKALVGAEFTFKLNGRGELSDIKVPEKLMESVRQANPGGGSMFSDEGMKNLITQSGLTLSESALDPGKTWTQQSKLSLPMLGVMILDKTYTFQGPDEAEAGRVKIALDTKVAIQPAADAAITMKIDSQGGKGVFSFDLERGRVVSSRVEDLLAMTLSVQGQEIGQTTKTVTEMKLSPEKTSK